MTVKVYNQNNFKKTTIFNDNNVEQYVNDYFICVNSTGSVFSIPHFKKSHFNVLNVYFDDTDKNKIKVSGDVVYYARVCTAQQAKEIKNFVDNIPDKSTVHIYCAKGTSRSPAVAKFVETHKCWKSTDYQTYNTFLYNLLCSI
jgi:predicted protein tyrosine phosphatase